DQTSAQELGADEKTKKRGKDRRTAATGESGKQHGGNIDDREGAILEIVVHARAHCKYEGDRCRGSAIAVPDAVGHIPPGKALEPSNITTFERWKPLAA
ncbi:hypothetical protein chiPu_0034033, partial [Chiloscyllium punctatum]|nr:hypothetical protein [Chiloscyllium punctatum]